MGFVPVPDTVKVVVHQTYQGQEVLTIHHFSQAGDWGLGEMLTLASAVDTAYETGIYTYSGEKLFLNQIEVIDLRTESGASQVLPASTGKHGSMASTPMPGNVAAVLTKYTAKRGRSYRGRTYVPGIDAGAITASDNFDSSWVGHILSAFGGLWSSATALGWILCVVSYQLNKVKRTTGVATPVTAVGMDNIPDSQRRRLPGRGK